MGSIRDPEGALGPKFSGFLQGSIRLGLGFRLGLQGDTRYSFPFKGVYQGSFKGTYKGFMRDLGLVIFC